METREDLIHLLPEKIQAIFAPTATPQQRMMAARGLLPTTPENLVLALLLLQSDPIPAIGEAAAKSIHKLPQNIILAAIQHPQTPGIMLSALAPLAQDNQTIGEALLLNSRSPNELIANLASIVPENLAEIIANNQQRIMEYPQIAINLTANPNALRSSIDKIFDFLARNAIVVENCPEYDAAMERLSPSERVEMANKVILPPEVQALLDSLDSKNIGTQTAVANTATQATTATTEPTPQVEAAQAPAATTFQKKEEEKQEEEDKKRMPIMKLIGTLNTAQKVALATKGNKEARSLLIKDSNKQVAVSVIKSPGITEQEIAAAAASRSVNEEVIRIICKSTTMQRSYAVKVALVNNPRVPLPLAMKLLPLLRKNDIKMIAKSKDIPSALVNMAKRISTS